MATNNAKDVYSGDLMAQRTRHRVCIIKWFSEGNKEYIMAYKTGEKEKTGNKKARAR